MVFHCEAEPGPSFVSRMCYSCMSDSFGDIWPHLEPIYYPPENFTKHCNSMDPGFEIGRRPCSHSVCVTVIEPQILAGQHVGNNVIRGCFSSVFKYGETPSFSGVADTNCTLIPMRKLLPTNLASRAGNRRVQMCWCVGRLCNDYPTVSSSNDKSQHGHIQVFHLIITCLLCLMSKL
uniref:Uncharacterized protein n=1 Tax=Acrobeloides nanus TaxID=290746 RepID=A0A914DPJ4_9BILA